MPINLKPFAGPYLTVSGRPQRLHELEVERGLPLPDARAYAVLTLRGAGAAHAGREATWRALKAAHCVGSERSPPVCEVSNRQLQAKVGNSRGW